MESKTLYTILSSLVYDSDKNNTLKTLYTSINPLTSQDLINILRIYIYDSDRTKAVDILRQKISLNPSDVSSILAIYVYDPDRNKTLEILTTINHIPLGYIPQILRVYVYDSDKTKATKIILNQPYKTPRENYNISLGSIDPIKLEQLFNIFNNITDFVKTALILGFSENDIDPYKSKYTPHEYYINGNQFDTSGMLPGSSIIVNGSTIKKDKYGNISVHSSTGNVSAGIYTDKIL